MGLSAFGGVLCGARFHPSSVLRLHIAQCRAYDVQDFEVVYSLEPKGKDPTSSLNRTK